MASTATDFSKGSVIKAIMAQSIPLLVAQIIQLLYNIVDRIYIGHLPGSNGLALTGVGVCFPIITLITAFTDWFGIGGTPLFSIARGKGDENRAHSIMSESAFLLIVTSVVMTVLTLIFMRPMLYALGASDATYTYAKSYFTIYILGTVFFMTGSGLNYYISAQGFPRIGMITTAIGAILNIILDPVLMFVLNWGVVGAAIATVISQIVSAVWVIRFLLSDKALFRLKISEIRFNSGIAREIATLGFANFLMKSTNTVTQAACNIMLRDYGGDLYIGIFAIINSIRDFISLPGTAITHASQPVLGYNFGARNYKRLKQGIVFASAAASSYGGLVWILILIFPTFFIRIFTPDMETITVGTHCLRLYLLAFIFQMGQFCGQSVFSALGQSKKAIFFSTLRKIIIILPLTLILPLYMGVDGVFAAEPISNIIGGTAAFSTMLVTVYFRLPKQDGEEARL